MGANPHDILLSSKSASVKVPIGRQAEKEKEYLNSPLPSTSSNYHNVVNNTVTPSVEAAIEEIRFTSKVKIY